MTNREYFTMKIYLITDMMKDDLEVLQELDPEHPSYFDGLAVKYGYRLGLAAARKTINHHLEIEQHTHEQFHKTKK